MAELRRFTIRPKIKEEESFSSYLLRIGSLNNTEYTEIFGSLNKGTFKRYDSRYNYYLDVMPAYILDTSMLSILLNRPEEYIEASTFTSMYSKFMEKKDFKEKAHKELGITKIIEHKYRRFCPKCIEKGIFKLHWQLIDIEICDVHEVRLQNKCNNCDSEQPYLNTATQLKDICYKCSHSLKSSYTKVTDLEFIEKQRLLIKNYQYLINPNNILINNIDGFDRERSLAIILLYIMNGEGKEFNRQEFNNAHSEKTIRRIIELARGIKKTGNLTIENFFEIIMELNIDIGFLKDITVPNMFIESLNRHYLITSDVAGNCLAPWCKSYRTNESMKKVKRSKYFKGRNRYSKAFVCTKCYMKYGYRRNDGHWEAADDKVHLIERFINFYPNETLIKKNREHFKLSLEAFYDLLGYACNYKLLPKKLNVKKPIDSNGDILAVFERLVQDGGNLFRQAQKKNNWTMGEFYYYLNLPEIQSYLHFDALNVNLVEKIEDFEAKVNVELEKCLKNNVKITVNHIASKLKSTKKTLKKYGLTEKIIKTGEKQNLRMIKSEKKILYGKIKGFCNHKFKEDKPILSKELYQYIGYSHTFLMKNHPDLYKYIVKLVDLDKERISKIKLEQYKIMVKEAINELIKMGNSVSQKSILKKSNLTDNVYRAYPELKDHIHGYLYQGVTKLISD
ncbi:TniQ family protein [Paenibacillus sedimenti]|uniref:TniQ family protein n=1 Tax=Paenibacillus sedimenti TaxID=2770274 RepID=A0A926KXN9_9BACL|nr:TniQ family protein [Paenibacillus sedimenti]MBD0383870.1 TniQ family protein [Paenibacillus sedimenti]